MAEKTINLDDRKYDALKRVFAEQGRDVDEEIVRHIEALYEELIPQRERDRIDAESVPKFPEDSFAIFCVKDGDDTICFTSANVKSLFRSAEAYKTFADEGLSDLSIDTLVYEWFGEDGIDFISNEVFSVLLASASQDERITAAVEYNLDCKYVYVHEGDMVMVYTFDDMLDALEDSKLALVRSEIERSNVMTLLLSGKECRTERLMSNPSNKVFTLKDLIECSLEDVHLVDRDEEHELATIVELNRDTLTEEGKQDWDDVLCARVERIYDGDYGVQIEVSGCEAERVKDFSFMLAGYVSEKDYDRWVNKPTEQGASYEIQGI